MKLSWNVNAIMNLTVTVFSTNSLEMHWFLISLEVFKLLKMDAFHLFWNLSNVYYNVFLLLQCLRKSLTPSTEFVNENSANNLPCLKKNFYADLDVKLCLYIMFQFMAQIIYTRTIFQVSVLLCRSDISWFSALFKCPTKEILLCCYLSSSLFYIQSIMSVLDLHILNCVLILRFYRPVIMENTKCSAICHTLLIQERKRQTSHLIA